ALDDTFDVTHTLLAAICLVKRQHEKAVAAAKHALTLNPNGAHEYNTLAGVIGCSGRWEESIIYGKKSIRLDPFPPPTSFHWLGRAYFMTGQYDDAILTFKKAIAVSPNYLPAHAFIAASNSLLGNETEANAAAEQVLRINPKFSLESYAKTLPYKNKTDIERYTAALRKAGLPDTPPLPLPDKPSIAVLAFDNLSGDPDQEYLSDGIAEEIITALSKTDRLFVIARNSSFIYKGKPVKVQKVSRELGVRYVLEGSIKKSGDQVRITAQLIDAINGQHLWAERYDRDLKDIFAIQDDITLKILTGLQVKLTEGEQARIWGERSKNIDVYLKSMEALSLWRKGTKESHIRFGQVAQELIEMAPESTIGYRLRAWYYWNLAIKGKSPQESIAKAFKLATKALSLDESDAHCHALLGSIFVVMRQYEKAIAEGRLAVDLNPNGAMVNGLLGSTLCYAGRIDEGIDQLKQGIRLNPFPAYWYYFHLGRCYRQKGQYEESLTAFKKAVDRSPDAYINHAALSAAYILLDREEEARAEAAKVLEIDPNFSVERLSKSKPYKNQADMKLLVDALNRAGLK
ncbi:tetratricopeptide repeat protein, partial [Thermodesulfobacteriota bacterium]